MVDAGGTGVLLIVFLITLLGYVASLLDLGGKASEKGRPEGPSTVILPENTRTPTLYLLPTSPNAEGLKTNHHHTINSLEHKHSTSPPTRERDNWILVAGKIKATTAEGRWMRNRLWPFSCVLLPFYLGSFRLCVQNIQLGLLGFAMHLIHINNTFLSF